MIRTPIKIFILLLSSAVFFLISGCKKEPDPVTITMITNRVDSIPQVVDNNLTNEIRNQYPHISVNRIPLMNGNITGNMEDYLSGAQRADIISRFVNYNLFQQAEAGALTLLDAEETFTQEKKKIPDLLNRELFAGTYYPALQPLVSLHPLENSEDSDGGTLFAIPYTFHWWGIFYKKSLFREHNLGEPETWDQFLALCDQLTELGIIPIAMGNSFQWPSAAWFDYVYLRLSGYQKHRELMNGTLPWNDGTVQAAFTFLADFLAKEPINPDFSTLTWTKALPLIENEEAGMYLMMSTIRNFSSPEMSINYDFFPFPVIDSGVPQSELVSLEAYVVPSVSPAKLEALESILTITSEEVQAESMKRLVRLPANKNSDISGFPDYLRKGADILENAEYATIPIINGTDPEMADQIKMQCASFFDNPDPGTIQDMLEELEQTRQRIYGDTGGM